MALDKKISQLGELTTADGLDELAIVDVSALTTKRISVENLYASPQAIGYSVPNVGIFTTLSMVSGATIDKFSTDGTLSSDSDTVLPTEKAVKYYVDTAVAGLYTNKIWQGDSEVVVIDTTGDNSITVASDSILAMTIDSTGVSLQYGTYSNEISDDDTLADASHHSLVTEYAIKTYFTNTTHDKIVSGLAIAQVFDSTSDSYFIVKVRDNVFGTDATTYNVVYYYDDTTSSNWINPEQMIDGNTTTYATAGPLSGTYTQINTSNTAPLSSSRFVNKVEIRLYGRDADGADISSFYFYPLFGGKTQGNSHDLQSFFGPLRMWTPWIDITNDPAAPSTWQWSDITNLDIKVQAVIDEPGNSPADLLEINTIEIKVSYKDASSYIGSLEKFRVSANGISVQYGSVIDEFSTDAQLADSSDTALPTERAVKIYVDTQLQGVRHELDTINIRHLSADSTATTGDVCLVNTLSGPVNIKMIEFPDGKVTIKKITTDSNPINVTTPGNIDGESLYVINVPYKCVTFLSDGSSYYII